MRLGVVSTDSVQKSLIAEVLTPVFGAIEQYDLSDVNSGLSSTGVHLLIVDFSDDAIIESEDVLSMLSRDEPVCLLNEVNLYPMTEGQRLAWRNKIINEIRKALPDFADEIQTPEEVRAKEKLHDIWVLGSSSGGPQAIREFFGVLPTLPISIVLVQHISEAAFKTFVCRVVDSAPNWNVVAAEDGLEALPGQIVCVPKDAYIQVSSGRFTLVPHNSQPSFNPSISASIRSICRSTPGKMGIIILTGMGDDGAAAIKEVSKRAISVMAQDAETCGAKSMPDSARATGLVNFTGSPQELARELTRMCRAG